MTEIQNDFSVLAGSLMSMYSSLNSGFFYKQTTRMSGAVYTEKSNNSDREKEEFLGSYLLSPQVAM